MGFYNSAVEAGASQRHKHMQVRHDHWLVGAVLRGLVCCGACGLRASRALGGWFGRVGIGRWWKYVSGAVMIVVRGSLSLMIVVGGNGVVVFSLVVSAYGYSWSLVVVAAGGGGR